MSLRWQIPDPDGAKVTECRLELLVKSTVGSPYYTSPAFDAGGAPNRISDDRWQATITDVTGDTTYNVRIRGSNIAGPGPWFRHEFKTAEKPAAPTELRCAKCAEDEACLEWQVADPDGAKVTSCEVQVYVLP